VLEVVHLDAIMRGAHLIGVAGPHFFWPSDRSFTFANSLDYFRACYVNKYIDYHAHYM
jgi:hypothetical protein